MSNALEVQNLNKTYGDFKLDSVSFSLPAGYIMGFVGQNGAGKTTTIRCIFNMATRESGEIKIFGLDNVRDELAIKQELAAVFDEIFFVDTWSVREVEQALRGFYSGWDSKLYGEYIKKFELSPEKRVKELSRGMKMKLSIAAALSHHAKLLILDEATSGLDPIVRDEILDVFLEFIQDEEHSVFLSSHITSDLEKIADYITFIHKGKIVFSEPKDTLLYDYGILKCSAADYENIDKDFVLGSRKNQFGVEALVQRAKLDASCTIDPASLEDIMLFRIKGESK